MSEDEKARKKQYLKEYNQKPEVRARRKERDSTPEAIERRKIKDKIHYDKHREKNLAQKKEYYNKTRPPRKHRDWRPIIDNIREELEYYKKLNIKPTLRTMFYRLYSKGKIYNTISDYATLSDDTTSAREASIKSLEEQEKSWFGVMPIDSFSDEKRIATRFDSELDEWKPERYISEWVNNLRVLPSVYAEQLLPMWINQPHYIEIWTEKSAMVGTFREVIGNRQVDIVPFSGQPSVSYLWDNVNRLKLFQKLGKKIHIFYYGDFDPSGENIEETIKKKLSLYGVDNIDFRRMALTLKQVKDFKLPTNVDAKTQKKLEKDANTKRFTDKYDRLYQIEIDALPALKAEEFRNIVINSIDQYFDNEVYQKVLQDYPSEYIKQIVDSKIQFVEESD